MMERRKEERRQVTRGYGPERRTQDLPAVDGQERRREQRRLKDRRQTERRADALAPFFVLDEVAKDE